MYCPVWFDHMLCRSIYKPVPRILLLLFKKKSIHFVLLDKTCASPHHQMSLISNIERHLYMVLRKCIMAEPNTMILSNFLIINSYCKIFSYPSSRVLQNRNQWPESPDSFVKNKKFQHIYTLWLYMPQWAVIHMEAWSWDTLRHTTARGVMPLQGSSSYSRQFHI